VRSLLLERQKTASLLHKTTQQQQEKLKKQKLNEAIHCRRINFGYRRLGG
jgi:hypothetical protein